MLPCIERFIKIEPDFQGCESKTHSCMQVHHTVKEHPYMKAAAQLYGLPREVKPKVVGLSASLTYSLHEGVPPVQLHRKLLGIGFWVLNVTTWICLSQCSQFLCLCLPLQAELNISWRLSVCSPSLRPDGGTEKAGTPTIQRAPNSLMHADEIEEDVRALCTDLCLTGKCIYIASEHQLLEDGYRCSPMHSYHVCMPCIHVELRPQTIL